MTTIPEVRSDMLSKASWCEDNGHIYIAKCIRQWERDLHRRPPVRKAAVKARKITARLATEVTSYADAYPEASYKEIGEHFNINTGRVSEILAGKRE